MKLFSAYIRLFKKHLATILLFASFLFASVLFMVNHQMENNSYADDKVTVAILYEECDSEFVHGFISQIAPYARVTDLKQSNKSVTDALFYRMVDYVIEIPEGFSKQLQAYEADMEPLKLKKYTATKTYAVSTIDRVFTEYCRYYAAFLNGYYTMQDVEVININKLDMEGEQQRMYYYFNYAALSTMALVVIGVAIPLLIFHSKMVKCRFAAAPLDSSHLAFEWAIYEIGYGIVIWLAHLIVASVYLGRGYFSLHGLLMSMNLFGLSVMSVGLGCLVSIFIKNISVASVYLMSVVFGICYLGGTFIPQQYLDVKVKSIVVFSPVYWYIRSNDIIGNISFFKLNFVQDIIEGFGIQYIFCLAFLCFYFYARHQKYAILSLK